MSGYDIKRSFDRAVHFVWNAADSQIYRELRRMEEEDLISSRLIHQDGKPNKRLYQLTPQGTKVLDDWLVSPVEPPYDKEPFLMRMFFMGRVEGEAVLRVLNERRDKLQSLLAVAGERHERFADLSRTEHPEILWWQVRLIEGYQRIHTAQLGWINELIADVESGAPPTAKVAGKRSVRRKGRTR
jgi:DNA-binding PadR family transcriptional regulator